jgi:Fur family transcriptional regulator, peroxide stress response regulator
LSTSPPPEQNLLDGFRNACDKLGLKVTHQRIEIFKAVAASREHPDAETVHRAVRESMPTISLDTVYRNLKLLASSGIISVVGMSDERARFDAKMDPHHHFVCIRCGAICDFQSDGLATLDMPAEAAAFGTPLSLQLEVKGVCRACSDR